MQNRSDLSLNILGRLRQDLQVWVCTVNPATPLGLSHTLSLFYTFTQEVRRQRCQRQHISVSMVFCLFVFKKRKKKKQTELYTLRSSRFAGRGPGLREETPVCPDRLLLTGDRGVLFNGAEEEFGFLTICSLGSLKNKESLTTQSDLCRQLGSSHRITANNSQAGNKSQVTE